MPPVDTGFSSGLSLNRKAMRVKEEKKVNNVPVTTSLRGRVTPKYVLSLRTLSTFTSVGPTTSFFFSGHWIRTKGLSGMTVISGRHVVVIVADPRTSLRASRIDRESLVYVVIILVDLRTPRRS